MSPKDLYPDLNSSSPALLERNVNAAELMPASELIEQNPAMAYLVSLGSKKSRQTMKSFLNIVARINGYASIETCPWAQLRRHHVQAVLQMLEDLGRAPATRNTYLAAIKGVMTEAWIKKQIDHDTYQQIKLIRTAKGTRLAKGKALAKEELQKLFFTCESDSSPKGLRDAAILAVLVGCGLRRSEIVALDLESIDFKEQCLKVLGKGDKERLAFMPPGPQQRVKRWIDEVRGDYPGPLFPRIRRYGDVTNERMSDQAIYYILDTRRVEAGLDEFAPHDLRRTFASAMLDNKEDIITVRDAMGHASVTTTQRYDHRGNDRLREASQRLDVG